MKNGVNGKTADVINSSWGNGNTTGSDPVARAIDGLIYSTGKTFVAAAGNGGPGPNTVGSPASGYNGISVGRSGPDTDPVPYNTTPGFSSRGPNDYQAPAGPVIPAVRPAVDSSAPGQDLTLAYYGGTTGGNKGGHRHVQRGEEHLLVQRRRDELHRARSSPGARRSWPTSATTDSAAATRSTAGSSRPSC